MNTIFPNATTITDPLKLAIDHLQREMDATEVRVKRLQEDQQALADLITALKLRQPQIQHGYASGGIVPQGVYTFVSED